MRSFITKFLVLFTTLISNASAAPEWILRNPRDGTMRIRNETGKIYRSLGASLYPFWAGSLNEYTRKLMMHGKGNGMTSYRAILIFEQINGNPDENLLWSDLIWKPIDSLLQNAYDLNVHVTVELSGLANWMMNQETPLDPFDSTSYPLWDQLVDFVTSRRNSYTGRLYRDDPTILMYSVLGEVIPYSSAERTRFINLLKRVSARLKQKDPRHLVGSGGLLHVSQFSGYNDPSTYWDKVYAVKDVDIGMLHVYQSPEKTLPKAGAITYQKSEWSNLSTYSKFCKSIGKPFIVDEFGLQLDAYDRETVLMYFDHAYQSATAVDPPVSMIQVWNWNPGPTFDIFPNEDLLLQQIIRKYARQWGFTDSFATLMDSGTSGLLENSVPVITLTDFEVDLDGATPAASLTRVSELSSIGEFSIRYPWQFDTDAFAVQYIEFWPGSGGFTKSWNQYAVKNGQLACDIYLSATYPKMPTGYQVRFAITGKSGRQYFQTMRGTWNNFLMLFQWNRVYTRLDPDLMSDEFAAAMTDAQWLDEMSAIRSFKVGLVHRAGDKTMQGFMWIDNCRLGVSENSKTQQLIYDNVNRADYCPVVSMPVAGLQADAYQPLFQAKNTTATSWNADGLYFETPDNSSLKSRMMTVQVIVFLAGALMFFLSIVIIAVTACIRCHKTRDQRNSTTAKFDSLHSNDSVSTSRDI